MIESIIFLSLGVLILSMTLSLFSSMAKLAFDFHAEILAYSHLEKSQILISKIIHTAGFNFCTPDYFLDHQIFSEPLKIISSAPEIRALGLNNAGRGKYQGSGHILEIISGNARELFHKNPSLENLKQSCANPTYQISYLYHCEAGLCVKNNLNNKRQVLVTGISQFQINLNHKNLDFYLAEKKISTQWVYSGFWLYEQ